MTPEDRKKWKDFQANFRGRHLVWWIEVWEAKRATREEMGTLAEQQANQLKELFKEIFEHLTGIRVDPDDTPIRLPLNGTHKAPQQPQPTKGKTP